MPRTLALPFLHQLVEVQLYPGRRVIAGLGLAAHPAVHARLKQARRELTGQQQVVDAQAGIALPVLAEVIPEREDRLVGIELPDRVGPALREETPPAFEALR